MDVVKSGFGECLKNLRKLKNYTQEKLAEAIGINLRQLARIEAGESFVTSETLYKICEVLQIEPWELFNFSLEIESVKTGTDNVVYLNVIKNSEGTHLVTKPIKDNSAPATFSSFEFDNKMSSMAKRIKKEIIVDEYKDGVFICKKLYKPTGEIEICNTSDDENNLLLILRKKIDSVAEDCKKLEFLNLAFEALTNKSALNELKILIKGIELIQ